MQKILKRNSTVKSVSSSRLRVMLCGQIQGVGFRPFVFKLAGSLGLNGWVQNTSRGVVLEVEGSEASLGDFLCRLEKEKPEQAFIHSLESCHLDVVGYTCFEIRKSLNEGQKEAVISPDIATCPNCLSEITDDSNRRYRYPFTNCTQCGPRFTFLEKIPYDRPNTTMKKFSMCEKCQTEYDNPSDRRFHAQPNACPDCGPQVELLDSQGQVCARENAALELTRQHLREGAIVAVKGLGGFHLMAKASDEAAVLKLRKRKIRKKKPFALMCASIQKARELCEISEHEERLLLSAAAPIVLLKRKPGSNMADAVAPDNPYLGVLLAFTPLHHLLLSKLDFSVVATSGNLSEEPIVTDNVQALEKLAGIADYFLMHDRPIARPVDDSIVRMIAGREMILRRARGYAPLPIMLDSSMPSMLAVGGHLKNTVAFSKGKQVFMSQHLGDMEDAETQEVFQKTIEDFKRLYEINPQEICCDLHPGYFSTEAAQKSGLPVKKVQHHHAHIFSCMADNHLAAPVLGVAWDGTGYGSDGTLWGGEFFKVSETSIEQIVTFRSFPLPGGAQAIREPRRTALGLIYEMVGVGLFKNPERSFENVLRLFNGQEKVLLEKMLEQNINSPYTSSVGRIFDAVSALLGICQENQFEGQAAMALEFEAQKVLFEKAYPFTIRKVSKVARIDYEPMIRALLEDFQSGREKAAIATAFHQTLAEIILVVAQDAGEPKVVLSGGCFQNRVLTEKVIYLLRADGFSVYWHQRVPPNDGGLSLGQIIQSIRSS